MAKGQMRSNKEAKKPKKVKEPVAVPESVLKGISANSTNTATKKKK
ncbi:hypothetical protein [Thalassospira sp.]|nr:hypothetical protein [Thalassospira sp.]MDP2698270.1 hypothetical protein [Thalassospira sp.]